MSLLRNRRYRVVIRGEGILVHVEGKHDPIVGFTATRFVRAVSPEEASLVAQARVRGGWFNSPYSTANRASDPVFRVAEVERVKNPFRLSRPNRGYHFLHASDTGEKPPE